MPKIILECFQAPVAQALVCSEIVHWVCFSFLPFGFYRCSNLQGAQKWKGDSNQTAYFSPLCGATGLPVARKPRWQKVVNKYLGHIP